MLYWCLPFLQQEPEPAPVRRLASSSFTQSVGGFAVVVLSTGGTLGSTAAISGYTLDALGTSSNKEAFWHESYFGSTGSVTVTATWTTAQGADLAVAAWR